MFESFRPRFDRLSAAKRLLAAAALVCIVILIAAWSAGPWWSRWVGAAAIAILLLAMQDLWLPRRFGRGRLRNGLLAALVLECFALPFLHDEFAGWMGRHLASLVAAATDGLLDFTQTGDDGFVGILQGVVVGLTSTVYKLLRDRSVMTRHPRPVDREFPEKTYSRRRDDFCRVLGRHIENLNTDANWSDAYYTPLDAEVEFKGHAGRSARVMDLLRAIKQDHSTRLFVVLGDPGSGKSVAMRKLAVDLLREVRLTEKVPIYVNLKEWHTEQSWTPEHPPTDTDLRAFIEKNLRQRLDTISAGFVHEYFERMLEDGRFFFLLDSFDEIPGVLDVDEGSWLIRELSRVADRLFSNGTRGVLASRLYRRPRLDGREIQTLEVRPFDERRIDETLQHGSGVRHELIKQLFVERTELVPIARNPFTAELLRAYIDLHHGFPANQVELYRSYVKQRIEASLTLSGTSAMPTQEVLETATEIAWVIFNEQRQGLEIVLSDLEQQLPGRRVQDVVRLLAYAKLARVSRGVGAFSFVHRRFNEYFVAMKFIANERLVDIESIPTDSRFRDALVLYCEVAAPAKAQRLASACWEEIKLIGDPSVRAGDPRYLRAVHCLRFLGTAFRTRPDLLAPFRSDLEQLIRNLLAPSSDLLLSKHALESANLLGQEALRDVVILALQRDSAMLRETGMRACRYLPRLERDLDRRLRQMVYNLPFWTFVQRRQDLRFALSLSDGFRDVRGVVAVRNVDSYLLPIAIGLLVSHATGVAVVSLLVCVALVLFVVIARFTLLGLGALVRWFWQRFATKRSGPHPTIAFAALPKTILARYGFAMVTVLLYFLFLTDPTLFEWNLFQLATGHQWTANPWYFAGISSIIVAGLVPVYWVGYLRRLKPGAGWRLLMLAVGSTISGGIVLAIIFGMAWLGEWLQPRIPLGAVDTIQSVGLWALGALLALSAVVLLVVAVLVPAWQLAKDRFTLARLNPSQMQTRLSIEGKFLELRTATGRHRFVSWLESVNVVPAGLWAVGLPNQGDDGASERLALLEEKWLGLAD